VAAARAEPWTRNLTTEKNTGRADSAGASVALRHSKIVGSSATMGLHVAALLAVRLFKGPREHVLPFC